MAKAPTETFGGLHAEPLQEPLHVPLTTASLPDFDGMSDEELQAFVTQEATEDKYKADHLAPDGMKYQWARCEVYGQPDRARVAEMEQRGWRAVPQKRHDGHWMPPGTEGPIIVDGMMLMELPTRVLHAKRVQAARVAKQAVEGMNEQLVYTPPGTGPRGTHQYTRPVARSQPGAMEIRVE